MGADDETGCIVVVLFVLLVATIFMLEDDDNETAQAAVEQTVEAPLPYKRPFTRYSSDGTPVDSGHHPTLLVDDEIGCQYMMYGEMIAPRLDGKGGVVGCNEDATGTIETPEFTN